MTDPEFLDWVADRLVHVYGESPNVDFVQRLRKTARHMDGLLDAYQYAGKLAIDFQELRRSR